MMSKMEFQCKLAHEDGIKKVSCFNSIKELYERVSQVFSVPISEVSIFKKPLVSQSCKINKSNQILSSTDG